MLYMISCIKYAMLCPVSYLLTCDAVCDESCANHRNGLTNIREFSNRRNWITYISTDPILSYPVSTTVINLRRDRVQIVF